MENRDKQWQNLLDKWNSGAFNRSDEQALRKLLENGDEFLLEATKGYLDHSGIDHTPGLDRLQQRIHKHETAKSRPLPLFWLSVAAALLLLVVAGTWWFSSGGPESQPIAQTLPTTEPVSSAPTPPSIVQSAPTAKRKTPQTADMPVDAAQGRALPDSVKTSDELAVYEPTIKEEQADVAPAKTRGSALKAFPGTGKEDGTAVSENANGAGAERPAIAAPAPQQEAGKARLSLTAPEPVIGWARFRQDMETQLKLSEKAKGQGASPGVVTMILDIDPTDGKVRSVLFINKLGFGCDEEAEKFIRKYEWRVAPGGPTKIEVEVEFR